MTKDTGMAHLLARSPDETSSSSRACSQHVLKNICCMNEGSLRGVNYYLSLKMGKQVLGD